MFPRSIAVGDPDLRRCLSCITPQYANFIKYLTDCIDYDFASAASRGPRELAHHVKRLYDTAEGKWYPRLLVFFKRMPCPKDIDTIRSLFPSNKGGPGGGTTFLLLTADLHSGTQTRPQDVQNADVVVAATSRLHFTTLLRMPESSVPPTKIIHAGNRCPDEFAWPTVNLEAEDELFVYGAMYPERRRFLEEASKFWPVKHYSRPPGGGYGANNLHLAKETSRRMRRCAYAFASGYGFHDDPKGARNSRHHWYLVAKFFEVMGTGCLLICDDTGVRDQLEELGFRAGEHYIRAAPGEVCLSELRKYVRANPKVITDMRERAHKLVIESYTVRDTCASILRKFIN